MAGLLMRINPYAVAIALLYIAALEPNANAQAMTPMRGEVRSVSDAFAVRVYPSNPYPDRIKVEVHVYDQNFFEVPAEVSPATFSLAGGASRRVTVMVPFNGQSERKVRICTESIPFPNHQANIRTQICGKFRGTKLAD